MPTYEYACTACDHRFEAVQSFTAPTLTDCPVCEGKVRKLFSAVGIVFRGPGFYRTDSRAGSGTVGGEGADGDKARGGKPDKGDKKPGEKTKDKTGTADKAPPSKSAPSTSTGATTTAAAS